MQNQAVFTLSEDVLRHTMSFLHGVDRLEAGKVSRTWRDVACVPAGRRVSIGVRAQTCKGVAFNRRAQYYSWTSAKIVDDVVVLSIWNEEGHRSWSRPEQAPRKLPSTLFLIFERPLIDGPPKDVGFFMTTLSAQGTSEVRVVWGWVGGGSGHARTTKFRRSPPPCDPVQSQVPTGCDALRHKELLRTFPSI